MKTMELIYWFLSKSSFSRIRKVKKRLWPASAPACATLERRNRLDVHMSGWVAQDAAIVQRRMKSTQLLPHSAMKSLVPRTYNDLSVGTDNHSVCKSIFIAHNFIQSTALCFAEVIAIVAFITNKIITSYDYRKIIVAGDGDLFPCCPNRRGHQGNEK